MGVCGVVVAQLLEPVRLDLDLLAHLCFLAITPALTLVLVVSRILLQSV
jgi:hypothetical protein